MLSHFYRLSSLAIRFSQIALLATMIGLGRATSSVADSADAPSLPSYMDVIVGDLPPLTSEELADQNLLALDLAMFGIYDDALTKFQANFLAQHPIVMALFVIKAGSSSYIGPASLHWMHLRFRSVIRYISQLVIRRWQYSSSQARI